MKILGPKFIRPANSWCVTLFKDVAAGQKQNKSQEIHWFTTKEEAQAFIEKTKGME